MQDGREGKSLIQCLVYWHYLLKPVQAAERECSLQKYESRHPAARTAAAENVQRPVHATPRARFLVKSGQALKAALVEQVAHFLAEEDVVFPVTPGKRYILPDTLDQREG